MLQEITEDQLYELIINSWHETIKAGGDVIYHDPINLYGKHLECITIDYDEAKKRYQEKYSTEPKASKDQLMTKFHFEFCHVKKVVFKNINMDWFLSEFSKLVNIVFETCTMNKLRIGSSVMYDTIFINCALTSSYFDRSDMFHNEFKECLLDLSNFVQTNMIGNEFSNCDLSEVLFNKATGANIKFVDNNFYKMEFNHSLLRTLDFSRNSHTDSIKIKDSYISGLNTVVLQISGIGSRNDTTIYRPDINKVICGCWSKDPGGPLGGTLEEFKERVLSAYPDPENQYHKEYMKAIELLEIYNER